MLNVFMVEYTEDNVLVINSIVDAIRLRPNMYVGNTDPLFVAVEEITGQFQFLGVTKHHVREIDDFILIEAKEDWLDARDQDFSFEAPFTDWVETQIDEAKRRGKEHLSGPRGEAYLTAFYFPYYTVGPAGTLGDARLLKQFSNSKLQSYIEADGRFFLISKQQNLPKDHGICFKPAKKLPKNSKMKDGGKNW